MIKAVTDESWRDCDADKNRGETEARKGDEIRFIIVRRKCRTELLAPDSYYRKAVAGTPEVSS